MSKIGSPTRIESVIFALGAVLIAAAPVRAEDHSTGPGVIQVRDTQREAVRSRSSVLGFRRTVRGAHAETGEYDQDRPYVPGRGYVQSRANPQQTCNFYGGNGLPVQVCW
jgi:hypothetical protein